jgi:hypothetical protein
VDVAYLSALGYRKVPLGLVLALAVGGLLVYAWCRVRRQDFGSPIHVALSLPLGLLCLYLFSYYRYMHSFGSGHAVLLVLAGVQALVMRESAPKPQLTQPNWREAVGTIVISLCLLLGLVWLFASLSFVHDGAAVYPAVYNLDLSFYANVGELIRRTGIESRQIEPFAAPIVSQPYHYSEIWLAVFFADLDGTTIYANSVLVVNPLLRVGVVWVIYWYCRAEGLSWGWALLLALSALVLAGIKWDDLTTAPPATYASWYSSYLLTPDGVSAKRLCSLIGLVGVWLVYRHRGDAIAFAGLLLLPFFNFSLTLPVLGGVLGLGLHELLSQRSARALWLLALTVLAIGCLAVPVMQSGLSGAVHASALGGSPDLATLMTLPAKALAQAAASYLFFVPALIIWVMHAKRVERMVISFSMVAALVGWCLLYASQDARQIYTNFASLLFMVLIVSAAQLLIRPQRQTWYVRAAGLCYALGIAVCIVQAGWFTSTFYPPAEQAPEQRLWAKVSADGPATQRIRALYFAEPESISKRPVTGLYWIFNPLVQLSWRYDANVPTIGNPWALGSLVGSDIEEVRAKSPLYQLGLREPGVPQDSLVLRFIRSEGIDALILHVVPNEALLRQLPIRHRYLSPDGTTTFVWLDQAYTRPRKHSGAVASDVR